MERLDEVKLTLERLEDRISALERAILQLRSALWLPMGDFMTIGDGFFVRNVRLDPHPSGVKVVGEIWNDAGDFPSSALFKVRLFDREGSYIGGNHFSISSFRRRTIRPFDVIVPRLSVQAVGSSTVEFVP